MPLNHLKPHGALYGRAAKDEAIAHAVADAAEVLGVPVLGHGRHAARVRLHGPRTRVHGGVLRRSGLRRRRLAARSRAGTRPTIPNRCASVSSACCLDGVAIAQSGREIPMRADCVCIHSDTPGAPDLARAAGEALREVQPPQTR